MDNQLKKDLNEELKELEEKNLLWNPKTLEGPSVARSKVGGKEVVMLCSNNYLGLSNNPILKEAAKKALEKYGVGSGSVRAIAGTFDLHIELEKTIAKFKGTEDSLYYNTGFTANSGAIPALLREGDAVISDELNHGSIIDGVRLTKATRYIYKHKDMGELEQRLQEAKEAKRIFIITDGVFSMDGDIAPLDKIVELAEKYHAAVYVDDAHGDGVLGEKGKGISNHFDVEGKVDADMGTFSKGFGTMGGYIAGSHILKKFLLNKSRTWLLTCSHSAVVTAASIASLKLLESSDELVKKLWKNRNHYKKQLESLGFDCGFSETPIVPIMTYDAKKASDMSKRLFEEGVYALPIVFPMVAKDKARIRSMIRADLSMEDLDFAINKIEKVGRELKII